MDAAARTHTLHFPQLDRRIDAREDETLYAAARRAGVRIVGACGGRGGCGSCVVRVAEGEVERGGESSRRQWLRACRLRARSDLTLEVAPRSLAHIVRTEVSTGDDAMLPLDAAVHALALCVPPATVQDPAGDGERTCRAIAEQAPSLRPAAMEACAIAELPLRLRAHDGRVCARVALSRGGPRLLGVAPPGAPLLGLAVDLGTTNAAAFLVDLASGRRLASLGVENPQVAWGADLVTRIDQASAAPAVAEAMRQAAATAIDALAHDLARAVGAGPGDIVELAVCGNTAMQHLLAGWPVAQLGRAPFVAATHEAVEVPAHEWGLHVARGAHLHLAPGIGGFVGGDHVAALLATEPVWSQPGTTLVMDIGTNTEISLVHRWRIWTASCPSGPALEGGHIASGMRAARGAIERVAVVDGGDVRCRVIGGGPAVGVCGSGVLDALAAFVGAGWIDARGRIAGGPRTRIVDGIKGIALAEEAPGMPAVRLTQHDVRAVQLAKSAIRSGVALLAAEAGIDEAQIDRFVIAGAFGACLRVDSGVAIGLFPPLPAGRFAQVGNAAGLGAQQMLASRARRARAARLAHECRYVELGARADFQKAFLHHLGFGAP